MGEALSLDDFLVDWAQDAGRDPDLAKAVHALAAGCRAIGERVARGALSGGFDVTCREIPLSESDPDVDRQAHETFLGGLQGAPIGAVISPVVEEPVVLDVRSSLIAVVSPLDGSASIDTNAAVGTVFAILRRLSNGSGGGDLTASYLQPGNNLLAAGFVVYGPRTALVLTLGDGTHAFTLDANDHQFLMSAKNVKLPATGREYAINAANYRHWNNAIQTYVDDCLDGSDGLRSVDFNMRWIGSPVAEIYRIFTRGGIYLYPADAREGYRDGRFRLIFEASPIAMVVEQAGGAATTGLARILDLKPTSFRQRVPMILGSRAEVEYVEMLHQEPQAKNERSPLFGQRGLFRT